MGTLVDVEEHEPRPEYVDGHRQHREQPGAPPRQRAPLARRTSRQRERDRLEQGGEHHPAQRESGERHEEEKRQCEHGSAFLDGTGAGGTGAGGTGVGGTGFAATGFAATGVTARERRHR
ncbi:hypothetical protein [Streptomyces sp. NPDC088923]|uniref:hypothetical protein n=1 Tax=Streptomyces sp. NPDC088923 TaxID=3365913 RepID=UPI003806FBBD